MSRRIELLRLDYTFSVIIPILIAIYLNDLNPFKHFDIIIGFIFLAITGNTWNDVADMKDPAEKETLERVKGYTPREIFTIGLASFIFGITLLLRTCLKFPINGLFLTIIIGMVLLYVKWLKPIPILNQILLGASHVFLPYLMIKVDAEILAMSDLEWFLMLTLLAFAVTGQFVHEVIDSDALTKYFNLRQCQIIIWVSSATTLVLAILVSIISKEYYFFPFLFMPIGTMYTFRHPTKSKKGVKDVGILIGNFLLLYFICLITIQMLEVI